MTLLAILCPPLAVAAAGRPMHFITNVFLTLCFYVPGLIHALMVIGNIEKRELKKIRKKM